MPLMREIRYREWMITGIVMKILGMNKKNTITFYRAEMFHFWDWLQEYKRFECRVDDDE